MKATLVQPTEASLDAVFANPSTVFVASPWISTDGVKLLDRIWKRTPCTKWEIWTRLDPMDFLQGTSDFEAILAFAKGEAGRTVQIRVSSELHMKFYWGGGPEALLCSANLSSAGFGRNIESGVALEGTPGEFSGFLGSLRNRVRPVSISDLESRVRRLASLLPIREKLSEVLKMAGDSLGQPLRAVDEVVYPSLR